MPGPVLLLAGTAEARALARALAARDIAAVASLAGVTEDPAALALPTRRGGFGGAAGFAAYLDAERIHAIIDATHPFATHISQRTALIAAERGLPCLRLLRPEWRPGVGDRWHEVADVAGAAAVIPPGARVFAALGRQALPALAALPGRRLYLRQIARPDTPFPYDGDYVLGRPGATAGEEAALFARLGIDWVLTKNAGGAASAAKLAAARDMALPVAMIRRPTLPAGPGVGTVADALAWIEGVGE
ncbi:cobalt-precorrin-6A reductase [Mesobaculum littorinae]|uniref:Cobalt-precorrin-6A reductase n=1 Tax=Mesobaculum littorinae TaxID=2486419 RepID=A0A438AMH2_9RHOB|nr:cobalt-precorrin-6A reductase [Mesobaculum littorinae]